MVKVALKPRPTKFECIVICKYNKFICPYGSNFKYNNSVIFTRIGNSGHIRLWIEDYRIEVSILRLH